jgi:hypothetical protein
MVSYNKKKLKLGADISLKCLNKCLNKKIVWITNKYFITYKPNSV